MATIQDFFTHAPPYRLEDIISKYNLKNFVETGTGIGDSVDHVLGKFKNIISIEIHPEIAQKASERFKDNDNVTIINGHSTDVLKEKSGGLQGNTLFWLDAHFPGADFKYAKYEDEKDPEKRIPLEGELNAICDTKDFSNDVFLIDDLRVYEDGPYQGGNWPLRESLGGSDIRFVEDLLKSSHYIIKDYRFGGFLTIFPIIKAS
jgi:hypothetical protein